MDALCRCCLDGDNSSLYPLSSILIADANLTILEVLGTVTSCRVNESKTLPDNICPRCLKSLKKAFDFITMFEDSQMKLVDLVIVKTEDVKVELNSDEVAFEKNIILHENVGLADATIKSEDDIGNEEKSCDSEKDKTTDEEFENYENQNIILMSIDDVLRIDREEKLLSRAKSLSTGSTLLKPSMNIEIKEETVRNETTSDSEKQLLDNKIGVHNSNSHINFQCKQCGIRCRTESALLHHMGKHRARHFECYLCGLKYFAKKKLAIHIKIRHQSLAKKKNPCSICGRSYASKGSLQVHMKRHSNKREFFCSSCPFTTVLKNALKVHERSHTGERPYKCQYCSRRFINATAKASHENIHNGIKNFQCPYCPMKFVKADNLAVHKLTHPGNFFCHACSKSFPEAATLRRHFKRVHITK